VIGLAHALGAVLVLTMSPTDGAWRPPELAIAKRAPATDATEIKSDALNYLGRPYVTGGVGSPGFDCSGLTCRVFAQSGYALPRVSRDQARAGRSVPLDQLVPGDLLIFVDHKGSKRVNHVGIYLGDGEMVHASSGQGRVVVSNLRADWYQDRLFAARRVLPDPGTTTSSTAMVLAQVTELEEHDGVEALLPMLRLPPDLPPPMSGPTFFELEDTGFALRIMGASEHQRVGAVIAPEATLIVHDYALAITAAVPIRFAPDGGATLGVFERFGDGLKFLRSASLGLREADLELRLSRFGDVSLAGGMLVDRHQPSVATPGVPGLSVARTPLTFFGAHRGDDLTLELMIDDVAEPGVFGAGATVTLISGWLSAGGAIGTDQRAERVDGKRRAITGAEANLTFDAVATPSWSVSLAALGATLHAGSEAGFAAKARLDAEYRFSRGGTQAVSFRLEGARLSAGFLDSAFGPTYAIARGATYQQIAASLDRFTFGGGLELRLGRWVMAAGHHENVGAGASELDRRTYGLLEVRDLALLGTTLFDLRVSWDARGLATKELIHVLHGGLRVRLESWLYGEAYVSKGFGFEGGLGLTGAWEL